MAEGGWGSGTWGEAGWGMSVYYRDAAETATTSDTEAVAGSTFLGAVNEIAEGIDFVAPFHNYFSGVEDGASVSDTSSVASSTLGVSVSEAATMSDANSAQQVFACNIVENVDIFSPNFDPRAQQVFATAVSESATGADALDANFAYFASADETATASETASTQHVMPVSVSESATGADSDATAVQVFDSRVSESAVASVEAVVAASIFYAYLVAGATIADTLTARFLWEPIDDNQDANWQNINDAQTQSWTPVQTV
jgi:hypothetical protein